MYEQEVTHRLGIGRKSIVAARRMIPPTEWRTSPHGVEYTPDGLRSLCAALGLSGNDAADLVAFESAPTIAEKAPEPQEASGAAIAAESAPAPAVRDPDPAGGTILKVCRIYRNPHIVGARFKAGGMVRVHVKNAANFRIGMQIQAVHVDADLFELIGPCPRRPGRW
jgi:hypothetical protein